MTKKNNNGGFAKPASNGRTPAGAPTEGFKAGNPATPGAPKQDPKQKFDKK